MPARRRIRKPSSAESGASSAKSAAAGVKKNDTSDIHDDEDIKSHVPKGLSRVFVESKLHEKHLREAGLTPPSDFEGDMPELPDDIGKTDHEELSNLMLSFQNAHATATWQQAMAYIESDIMEEIADYLENKAILASEQSNDKKRTAEARTSDEVVFFRSKHKAAYHDYVRFRDLAKTLDGKIKVLSRVGGFKDDEMEAGDRSARAKDSAGASRRRRVRRD